MEGDRQHWRPDQALLLTAQRRDKVASMKWDDISNGTWSVPNGDRQKGTGGDLVLPEMALDIINARPRFASNPYVFAARGDSLLAAIAADGDGDLPSKTIGRCMIFAARLAR